MRTLSTARIRLLEGFCVLPLLLAPSGARAFDFVEGHFYATSGQRITQYDADGERVDVLNLVGQFLAPNREFRGLAFGPDRLLYVAQVRDPGHGFRVIALDASGSVHSVLSDPAVIWNNLGFGKLAFDEAGLLHVGTNSGLVRFDPASPGPGDLVYDQGSVFDVEPLPSGNSLIYGPGLREIDPSGAVVRDIHPTDPNGVAGGGLFFLSSPHGLEYDPESDEIYLSMGGFTGQSHRVMRTDRDGVLLAITTFINPQDLYFSPGHLLVGSRTFAPGLFDSDLTLLRTLGPDEFDDHLNVTRFDPPVPLAIVIAVEPGPQRAHVNPLGRKPIPVLILGAEDFDVATIDVASVVFGPHDAQPLPRERSRDRNGDGVVDLLLRFDTSETGIAFGDVEACLSGQTLDGVRFEGCDAIRTLPPGCGTGFELALLLPAVVLLRRPRRMESIGGGAAQR